MMEDIGALIKEVGFPAVVALYVLVRLNGKMEKLIETMERLRSAFEKHQGNMRGGK